MQHLLARAKGDAGGVRDDVRGYLIEHRGDPGAVLVIDQTGDVTKGTASAGVPRQYTSTAGRIENAQVAVWLGYAAPGGHTLIDRDLYLPKSWTADEDRCAAAGIPAGITFAAKPQLARKMIERAVTANGALRLGRRGCGVRGQRAAADLAGTAGDRPRARSGLRSPGALRSRADHPG
jgi:SRSO17 transposase